jgi:hypothetical protein
VVRSRTKCEDATKVCDRFRSPDAHLVKVIDYVCKRLPVQLDHRARPRSGALARRTAYKIEVLDLPIWHRRAVKGNNILGARPIRSKLFEEIRG